MQVTVFHLKITFLKKLGFTPCKVKATTKHGVTRERRRKRLKAYVKAV